MNNYIVSLTTIPTRINFIEKTIKSLVEQTLKPSKIILNIPKKYISGGVVVTNVLENSQALESGIEIGFFLQ